MTEFTIMGRIVGGEGPYKTRPSTDNAGKPKMRADGTPQVSSYVPIAIPKSDPNAQAMVNWLGELAKQAWPNGEYQRPDFANKIEDGDSAIPNKKGKKNCDREGWPGHWIIKFGSGYAPRVIYWDTVKGWTESLGGHVKVGDFVTVIGDCVTNAPSQSPGMYMNCKTVAFEREGPEIKPDAPDYLATLGARGPGGAPAGNVPPAPAAAHPAQPPAGSPPPAPTASPTSGAPPYTGYMPAGATPPAPPAPAAAPPPAGPQMTAAATTTYDAYRAAGWTDDQLRASGFMV